MRLNLTNTMEKKRDLKDMKIVIKPVMMILIMLLLLFFNNEIVSATGSTGEEIPEGYTPIYNIDGLYAIRSNPSGNYILMNDIDMKEETMSGGNYDCGNGWDSIEQFSGILDGNGHRIIGMQIFGDFTASGNKNIGLFENVLQGTIKNLGMLDCEINVHINNSASQYNEICVGALVGYMQGQAIIDNCYVSGNVTVKGNGAYYHIGGLIGEMDIYSPSTIYSTYYEGTISNSYNMCNVDCKEIVEGYVFTGGVLGYSYCGTIEKLYNVGIVENADETSSDATFTIGAVCGYYHTTTWGNCNYLRGTAARGIGNNVDGTSCVALSEAQMKNARIFTGYDFEAVWEIDPYCAYPYPQLRNNRQVRVSSIKINKAPEKLEYFQGDTLDFSNATLDVTYEDEITTTIPITSDMLSGYDMNIIGTQMVIVEYRGKSISLQIEVKEIPVTSVTMPKSISIYRSKIYQLEATILPENASDKTLEWDSKDDSIVTVDENGLLKAKAKGTTTITVTTSNDLVAECQVTVLVASVSVNLNQNKVDLKEGESFQLVATIVPLESTDTISWESSNVAVADVYEGTIIAKSQGTAVITAYTESGVKNSCTVNVKLPFGDIGDIITDTETGEKYRILTVGDTEGTVEYVGVGDKNKKDITIPSSVTIENAVYKVTAIANDAFKGNNKITKVTIGDNVKNIGKNAFSGCKNLKSIIIGKNVTTIGSKAFYNCKSLTKVTIPSKVTKIDSYAFKNCKKISSVTIGKEVKTIGKEAFRGCSKLKSIIIKSKKLKTIGKNTFKGIKSSAKIKVPSSKLKSYKSLLKNKGQSKKVKITK